MGFSKREDNNRSIVGDWTDHKKILNTNKMCGRYLSTLKMRTTAFNGKIPIINEFGISCKLITLTKIYMNGTEYQVRFDNVLSEGFQFMTGLKQGTLFHHCCLILH